MVKSAVRVLVLLEALSQEKNGLSHADLRAVLDIPGSSLTALLQDLIELEYVVYDAAMKRYSLGAKVLGLSRGYLENLNLVEIGQPIVKTLFEKVQEFSNLSILHGVVLVKVYELGISDPLAYHLAVGESGPLYATAAGKAVLAFMPPEVAGRLIDDMDFRPFTKHTVSGRKALEKELRAIRAGECAYCREEFVEGMISMSLPVFESSGRVMGALSVNTRAVRFNKEQETRTAEALSEAAAQLNKKLGGSTAR